MEEEEKDVLAREITYIYRERKVEKLE